MSDRQLRFRFRGKDRYGKTSEPHLFLQSNLQQTLQKNGCGSKNALFLRSWFVEGHHPFLARRHEVAMCFVCHTPFLLLSEACVWR